MSTVITGNGITTPQIDSLVINQDTEPVAELNYENARPSGFKNYIINGKKVVNQSGLTTTDNSYNQDQWYKSGLNWYQPIEGDNNLISGKTYTLSWVGAATASYYVGTATSATINAQTFTAIANGGNLTLTIAAGQNLWIKFASDASGSTFNFVQLEEGTVKTNFEHRAYGLELFLCQRFYEQSFDTTPSAISARSLFQQSTTVLLGNTSFITRKRAIPTVTIFSISGTAGTITTANTDANTGSSVTANNIGVLGFRYISSLTAVATGPAYAFHFIASSRI